MIIPDLESVKAIAARAAKATLILANFNSNTADAPRAPTVEELETWTAVNPTAPIPGTRLASAGYRQRLIWDGAAWVAAPGSPEISDTALPEALATVVDIIADSAQSEAARTAQQQSNNTQAQVAVSNLSAVGAVDQVAATRAALDPLLTDGQRGLALSGEIVQKIGANINRLGWLSNPSIPLAGLSTTDARGDLQQRIADAQAVGKPLDGAGSAYTLPLGGAALDLGRVALTNATLNLSGTPASEFALKVGSPLVQIASGWTGAKGARTLTIPGHGCAVGDYVLIAGTEIWNPMRSYYTAGEECRVLEVVSSSQVVIDHGLRFDYAAFPAAALYRLSVAQAIEWRNVSIVGNGNTRGLSVYGAVFNAANLSVRGLRATGAGIEYSVASIHNYRAEDTYYTGTGTSYGLSAGQLTTTLLTAPLISGGRHGITLGGTYPSTVLISGGRIEGGYYGQALDAHGSAWRLEAHGTVLSGGVGPNAMHNVLVGCTISNDHNRALTGMDEAPDGATLRVEGGSITCGPGVPDGTETVSLVRSNLTQSGAAAPAARHDVQISTHIRTPGGGSRVAVSAQFEGRLQLSGRITRTDKTGTTQSALNIGAMDRVVVDVDSDGESILLQTANGPGGSLPDVLLGGRYTGGLGAGVSVIGSASRPVARVRGEVVARDAGNAGVYLDNVQDAVILLDTSGNGATSTNTANRCGLRLNATNIRLRAGSRLEERHTNALYALYAAGASRIDFDGAAYLSSAGTRLVLTGGSTVGQRGQVYESPMPGGVPDPYWMLTGSTAITAQSIAAGGSYEVVITVTGAAVGDTVILAPPAAGVEAGLEVDPARVSAANTVRVKLRNPTASAISHTGTWGARVMRA